MGSLLFYIGSQRMLANRDLEISDESEEKIGRSLSDYPKDETSYNFGEVSFHSDLPFHRAGPNQGNEMCAVMTVIIIADGVRHQQHRASQ
jgi:hypothetical protein